MSTELEGCPFSITTHVRADGIEINSIEDAVDCWIIDFVDGDWGSYDKLGNPEYYELHMVVITRQEYERRKADA
jgi:hypothetical protein